MNAAVPDHVKKLVDGFLNEVATAKGHLAHQLSDPRISRHRCNQASTRFAEYVKNQGVECTVVEVYGLHKPPKSNTVYPGTYSWDRFGHVVVVIDGIWIDWTARQIESTCQFPYVVPAETELQKWISVDKIRNGECSTYTTMREAFPLLTKPQTVGA